MNKNNSKKSFDRLKRNIIKDGLKEIDEYSDLFLYNTRLRKILESNELVISCYGSDGRLDKYNSKPGSIDLLVLVGNTEVKSDEIRQYIIDFVSNVKGIVFDNSYIDFDEKGNEFKVFDEIEVGKILSRINIESNMIDILRNGDVLYKFNNKYFPDRLIDAYPILGKDPLLMSMKKDMLREIINKSSIIAKFKKEVKNFFVEENIRKGRNGFTKDENHFDLNTGNVIYDGENYFGFKYGPLRALQYKIVHIFLLYVDKMKDENIVEKFPYYLPDRLDFFRDNKVLDDFTDEDYENLKNTYIFFRDLNQKAEIKNGINLQDDLLKTANINMDLFVELFNKLNIK